MKIDKNFISSLIFNIAETILIFMIGTLLRLPINNILIVMLSFMLSRGFLGTALHFKTWYRCLVWSALILLSLFMILKIDLVIAVLFTIFSAFIMTGKSNIKDMYLWNNDDTPSKYADIEDYIKYHELDDELIDFEKKLEAKDNFTYLVYKYRFKEHKSFKNICELLDINDNSKLVKELDKIAFAIRLYCKI